MTRTIEQRVGNAPLRGQVACIASKSYGHRILLGAALARVTGGRVPSVGLHNTSEDLAATRRVLSALLADETGAPLDCGESGTTLRLMVPVAAALQGRAAGLLSGRVQDISFTGQGQLMKRPMGPLMEAMETHGVKLMQDGEILHCVGRMTPGDYSIAANVSSQYISGLLFALPLLAGDSTLTLQGPVASRGYIEMTLDVLSRFGIEIRTEETGAAGEPVRFRIPGEQVYSGPAHMDVEGDWSNAAFWLAAGAIGGGPLTVTNLNLQSLQGDRAILEILRAFGAQVQTDAAAGSVTVSREQPLHGITVDVEQIPDLAPVLAVVAATAEGTSRLLGAARLRLKESDRLRTTAALVQALGGRAEEGEDSLTVYGLQPGQPGEADGASLEKPLSGGTVDGAGDHRIVMGAAVAAAACRTPVRILGAEAVNKSYPGFFEEREKLIWRAPTESI